MIRVSFFLLFIFCTMKSQAQLRLDVAGDARIEGKLNLSAPGNSLFIGTDAGKVDDGTDNRNLFIGLNTGSSNTSGEYNTFFWC